ncbi:tRNA lysidine(34) synthetase TilS [Pelagibacterium sp. 26DY04]|uniref:tRNA lysidine(34) synthetase TilS n=1 Tax=Pelagibacterium sp. 26DY04 TaxID=2967130 RepID=UPI002815B7C9|nr:tRNA lysidine(34) synthetase TilS [Pelagibacterium sp. 26DY04]WMT86285.1 tRNA lysidine(34) synthetase TilS [Pelagibacterium sp. 26DY04]
MTSEIGSESSSDLDPARLFAPVAHEETIGLAVSGGADSLALMLLYAAWTAPEKPKAIVYTLDHGLRPEARGEAEMVAREATRLGLPARLLTWEGPKPLSGKQQAARAARYRLIGEAMKADGVALLLTAHHRRDQAETMLMRLAHGSGVTGLGAMRSFSCVEGVAVFRPLLEISPDALAACVEQAGLSPALDPSNADPAYERTRWREALAQLEALGLTEDGLARAARRLQRIDALADRITDEFLAAHVTRDRLGVLRLARPALVEVDREIAIRALARLLAAASGSRSYALARIEALAERIGSGANFAATLGGARCEAGNDTVVFYREAGRKPIAPVQLAPGETHLWDGRFTITASVPARVEPATAMTRERFKALAGTPLWCPVAALRAAPLICDDHGTVLALGALVIQPGVRVGRPPLTASSANCGNRPPQLPGALVSPE